TPRWLVPSRAQGLGAVAAVDAGAAWEARVYRGGTWSCRQRFRVWQPMGHPCRQEPHDLWLRCGHRSMRHRRHRSWHRPVLTAERGAPEPVAPLWCRPWAVPPRGAGRSSPEPGARTGPGRHRPTAAPRVVGAQRWRWRRARTADLVLVAACRSLLVGWDHRRLAVWDRHRLGEWDRHRLGEWDRCCPGEADWRGPRKVHLRTQAG